MKYIISESRLENLVFKYLKSKLTPYDIMSFNISNYEPIPIWVVNDVVLGVFKNTKTMQKHGEFKIDESLFNAIMGIFSLSRQETKKLIKRYLYESHGFEIGTIWAIPQANLDNFQNHYNINGGIKIA